MQNNTKIIIRLLIVVFTIFLCCSCITKNQIFSELKTKKLEKELLMDSQLPYNWTVGSERSLDVEQQEQELSLLLIKGNEKTTFNPSVTNMVYIRDLSRKWKEVYTIRLENGRLNEINKTGNKEYKVERPSYISSSSYGFRYDKDIVDYVYQLPKSKERGFIIEDFEYTMEVPEGFILLETKDYGIDDEIWTFYDEEGEVIHLQKTKVDGKSTLLNIGHKRIATAKLTRKKTDNLLVRQEFKFESTNHMPERVLYSSEYSCRIRYKFAQEKEYDLIYRQEEGVLYMRVADQEKIVDLMEN